MAVVTLDQAREFYRVSANFYRQAPRRSVGVDEPIKVGCKPVEGGPRFAIVRGRKAQRPVAL